MLPTWHTAAARAAVGGLLLLLALGTVITAASRPRDDRGPVHGQAPAPAAAPQDDDPGILTPPAPREPRINGPSLYGVRPGNPFLYRIPATGDRPMRFSAQGLPEGLTLDPASGILRGTIADRTPRAYETTLAAFNAHGRADRARASVCPGGV